MFSKLNKSECEDGLKTLRTIGKTTCSSSVLNLVSAVASYQETFNEKNVVTRSSKRVASLNYTSKKLGSTSTMKDLVSLRIEYFFVRKC